MDATGERYTIARSRLRSDAAGTPTPGEPPALDLGAVAAVGPATGGVGFIAFGLHLELPAPEGCEPGGGPPDLGQTSAALRRVHGLLLGHLGLSENVGLDESQVGVARGHGGQMVVPARPATTLLLGAGGGGTVAVPGSRFGAIPGGAQANRQHWLWLNALEAPIYLIACMRSV